MNEKEMGVFLGRVAALVEQFERNCEQVSHALGQTLHQLPGIVRQTADEHLRRLPGEVMGDMRKGLEQPVTTYQKRLIESGDQLQQASNALAEQMRRAERLHRHLVWKVLGIAIGSLLLLLSGGVWLSQHYYDEIRQNQLSAQLLKAYGQADVTLCGERLCARVDKKARPVGDYQLLAPR